MHFIIYEDPLELSIGCSGGLFIFPSKAGKEDLGVAAWELPMLICTFSYSENYNLVSRLIKSLYPYGRILSEQDLGLLLCRLFYRLRQLKEENERKLNAPSNLVCPWASHSTVHPGLSLVNWGAAISGHIQISDNIITVNSKGTDLVDNPGTIEVPVFRWLPPAKPSRS